jgi:hypothetical protein
LLDSCHRHYRPLGQSDNDKDSAVAQEVTISSREQQPEVDTARIDDQVEDLPVFENKNMVENDFCSSLVFSYYNDVIKPSVSGTSRKWHGLVWKPISQDEMVQFLGILLRISLTPVDYGGYPAYFRDENVKVWLLEDSDNFIEILPETMGFVSMIKKEFRMSLNRFKQIRGAFHLEDKVQGSNGGEDKCYQIRASMNELNAASLANFVPEANCAFDKGGIALSSSTTKTSRTSSKWTFFFLPAHQLITSTI